MIATKFWRWHDSCAVVACAKICCDLMASSWVMASRSFHRIWIAGKKTLVKRAPGLKFTVTSNMSGVPSNVNSKYVWKLMIWPAWRQERVSVKSRILSGRGKGMHAIYWADSRFVSSQWETALPCNDVSHWLGTSLESALHLLRSSGTQNVDHFIHTYMMTSSNGNIFRVTGHLCGESTSSQCNEMC